MREAHLSCQAWGEGRDGSTSFLLHFVLLPEEVDSWSEEANAMPENLTGSLFHSLGPWLGIALSPRALLGKRLGTLFLTLEFTVPFSLR